MEALYDALCNDSLSASEVFETAVDHGFKTMSWSQLPDDALAVASSQIVFTNASVDRVNEWCQRALVDDDAWRLDHIIVGRK